MPEINPVTKDQLFEKKIAENTGSNYNVGDISDIVPVTKDQALLKEIALNSAGQSGDITELKGKVADNTGAIEAIVNVNGCCNVMPSTNYNNTENYGIYYTTNADKSITAQGATGSDPSSVPIIGDYIPNKYVGYKLSGCVGGSNETYFINVSYSNDGSTWATDNYQYDEPITVANYPYIKVWIAVKAGVTVNTTFYPMLYDARLNPTGYVPYAMTNRELTDAVNRGSVSVTADGVKTYRQLLNELFALASYSRICANRLTVKLSIASGVYLLAYTEDIEDIAANFGYSSMHNNKVEVSHCRLHGSYSVYESYFDDVNHDLTNEIAPSGRAFILYF